MYYIIFIIIMYYILEIESIRQTMQRLQNENHANFGRQSGNGAPATATKVDHYLRCPGEE